MSNQRGFSIIETLIAIGIFGVIGVAFITALRTGYSATAVTDEKVTAENLVRVQLEGIRSESYFIPPSVPYLIPPGNDPGAYPVPPSGITPPPEYTLSVEISQFCDSTGCHPINEIQQIVARISRVGDLVTSISDLKTNR